MATYRHLLSLQVRVFRQQVLPRCLDFFTDKALVTEAYFVYERVLKTIGLVRRILAALF